MNKIAMMNKIASWQDVDLTRLSLEPSADRAVIEITSCFDGSDLATIVCNGVLVIKINSALRPNISELPVFIGDLTVASYTSREAAKLLMESGYGFRFEDQNVLPPRFSEVTEVVITGGEIEAKLIVLDCDITLPPDSPPLTPRG